MKSPPAPMTEDDCDDIFGPPRTYPTGYCPPKNRPSMISAKYRQKEERRKVLKISMNKLKKIEDPESSLCRSVLINNTMKRLQQEARDEKIQKQQLNYPRCYDNDNLLNIKSEFIKNEAKPSLGFDDHHHHHLHVDFVVENDFDAKLAEEINTMTAKNMEVFSGLVDDSNLVSVEQQSHQQQQQQQAMVVCGDSSSDSYSCSSPTSRKRSFDEMEDCDVQDVLSQFYMPPTPRMLTCIDDDDENDNPKRSKLDETTATTNTFDIKQSTTTLSDVCDVKSTNNTSSTTSTTAGDFSVNFINNNNNNNNDSRLRYGNSQSETDSNNSFSCGHASMFNELQNNVYHNLIASLET